MPWNRKNHRAHTMVSLVDPTTSVEETAKSSNSTSSSPTTTTTTTTSTTSGPNNEIGVLDEKEDDDIPIIHRVNTFTTGNLSNFLQVQHDDYITAKQLTPSAYDRFLKKRFGRPFSTTEQDHSVKLPPRSTMTDDATTTTTITTTTTLLEEKDVEATDNDTTTYFHGAYAKVRQQLDYSYHTHYRKERQWLHDAIIEDCLLKHQLLDDTAYYQTQKTPNPTIATEGETNTTNPQSSSTTSSSHSLSSSSSSSFSSSTSTSLHTHKNQRHVVADYYDYHQGKPVWLPQTPWLIFTVGVHGAAKHQAIRHLIDAGRLPLLSLVCVDTDDLRRYLPEYATYESQAPATVNARTRKEAGYISETLTWAALQAGRNVVFYGSVKDVHWYRYQWIPLLRRHFPGLQVAALHVTAPAESALSRARIRARGQGNTFFDETAFLEQLCVTIPAACHQLRHTVDVYAELRHDCQQLELLQLQEQPPHSEEEDDDDDDDDVMDDDRSQPVGADWNRFTQIFDQRGRALSLSYPEKCSKHKHNNRTPPQPPTPVVHTHHKRMASIPTFSTLESSEDNHKADDMEFYGPYAHIRRTLDYTFHQNYTFERQHFQDAIVREFLKQATVSTATATTTIDPSSVPSRPWAVFTGKKYKFPKCVQRETGYILP
eukprot:scaffold1513_cov100-Amphora_coffeaeformis.AAC.7